MTDCSLKKNTRHPEAAKKNALYVGVSGETLSTKSSILRIIQKQK